MTILTPLTLVCAETSPAYLPRPVDPRWAEAKRIAQDINQMKVQNPGYTIYDPLVDSLVANTLAIAKESDPLPEPIDWTPPQRCVWRHAMKVPENRRWEVVEDRKISTDAKAFAVIRQSRWLVLCPFPGCCGAQVASFADRRFWCVDCYNRPVNNLWVEVQWPENPVDVERWLSMRPTHARNWEPGETEETLLNQDAHHFATTQMALQRIEN